MAIKSTLIKKILEILAVWIAGSKVLLKLFTPVIYLSNHVLANKKKQEKPKVDLDPFIIKYLGEPIVKNGPFKGMIYPSFQSVGSTIYPKIIGSYEAELHPAIESLLKENFDIITDIGCAEGYYAVGFALKNPAARVFAYDIDGTARELCRQMSNLNGVAERITIKDFFSTDSFKEIPADKKTLIICDCEGYEAELFNPETLGYLVNTTLLIETHDFIDPMISIRLEKLLSTSHDIRVVQSLDDLLKAKYYSFKELDTLSIQQRKEVLKEMRPVIMEWLIATPKKI
jgi:hypothetical protein